MEELTDREDELFRDAMDAEAQVLSHKLYGVIASQPCNEMTRSATLWALIDVTLDVLEQCSDEGHLQEKLKAFIELLQDASTTPVTRTSHGSVTRQ